MRDYLIFDQDYFDIPLQDLSENTIVVCHDPQYRCRNADNNSTYSWAVVETNDDCELPPTALGLFWEKNIAIIFAKAVSS